MVSKAWHVKTEDTFLALLYRKRSKLAATCRKCNVCTIVPDKIVKKRLHIYPHVATWAKKTFGGTSFRQPKSKKLDSTMIVPLIGDLQNCQNQ